MGKEEIAQRLKTAREKAGLSQDDAGIALGVSYQAISNYERGRNRIDVESLATLSRLYKVSPTYIITGEADDLTTRIPCNEHRQLCAAYDSATRKEQNAVRVILGLPLLGDVEYITMAARGSGVKQIAVSHDAVDAINAIPESNMEDDF